MTIEENKALIAKYPFLIPRWRWDLSIMEDYDYSFTELDAMPDGWRKAFGEQLCQELLAALEEDDDVHNYRILQIKEKDGFLRWEDCGASKKAHAVIQKYCDMSWRICMVCGKPATRVLARSYSPYCVDCIPVFHGVPHVNYPIEDYPLVKIKHEDKGE